MNAARRLATVGAVCLALVLAAGPAYATAGATGSIAGFVTDSLSPAAVPGAVVRIDQLTAGVPNGLSYTTTAGFSGDYSVANVPVGDYEITVDDPSGRHFQAQVAVTVAAAAVTQNVAMAPAGSITGTVRDALSPLTGVSGARVWLFQADVSGIPFPDPPAPDPGPATTASDGTYSFAQVVDPLGAAGTLLGKYHAAVFDRAYHPQFFAAASSIGSAYDIPLTTGSTFPLADFSLTRRTVTSLGSRSLLNDTASSIPSGKSSVRRGGADLSAWYDTSLGGIVALTGGIESLVATTPAPYDNAFDANSTGVYLGDGRYWDAATKTLASLGETDISGAQVVCDDSAVAFLYEVPSSLFDERIWRVKIVNLPGGTVVSADFTLPARDTLKLTPGCVGGGWVAVVGDDGTTGRVILVSCADGSDTAAWTSADGVAPYVPGVESAVITDGGEHLVVLDQNAGTIRRIERSDTTTSTLLVEVAQSVTLSGLRSDSATGTFLYTETDFTAYPLYEAAVRVYDALAAQASDLKRVQIVGTGALNEPTFTDYDMGASGAGSAWMVGQAVGERTHVWSTPLATAIWARADGDRFIKADHRAPDVGGGGVAWLDWRTAEADRTGLPDVRYRKPGGVEKLIAVGAYQYAEDVGLPQASERWVVYPVDGPVPGQISFEAYDLTDDTVRTVATEEIAYVGTPGTPFEPMAALTGDWLVWTSGADRTALVELKARNIVTGEERVLTSIASPVAPYVVYFKASGGRVLYVDGAGITQLYDIASDTASAAGPLPLASSFYAFEFDYPRAAYLSPMYESPATEPMSQAGTLKSFDFRTGTETTLEEFYVAETGRRGGKPFALWKQALVAGSRVYDLLSGTQYVFDTAHEPAFVAVDGATLAAEIAPDTPSPSGMAEADIYTLDLSSFVDAVAPVTTLTGVPSGIATQPVDLTLAATDAGSGVYEVVARVAPSGAVVRGTTPQTVSISAEGSYTVTYTSSDNWGNEDLARSAQVTFERAPETSMTVVSGTPGLGGWYVGPVGFSVTATDTGAGVDRTYVRVDGGAPQLHTGGTRTITTDGEHVVEYWSVDRLGIEETPHRTTTVRIDTTRPTTTNDNVTFYEGEAVITLGLSDAGSGPREMWWKTRSDPDFVNGTPAVTSRTFTYTAPADIGEHSILWWGEDVAGHRSHDPGAWDAVSFLLGADSVPQTTLGIAPAPVAGRYLPGSLVTLEATDTASGLPGSGVKASYYRIGSVTTTYTAPFEPASDGTQTIEYWSVDNVGHTETAAQVTATFDLRGPRITDDRLPSYLGVLDTVLTVQAVDTESGVSSLEYRLDGAATQTVPASGEVTVTAPVRIAGAGTHTLVVVAKDGFDTVSVSTITIQMGRPPTALTLYSKPARPRPRRWVTLYGTLDPGGRPDWVIVEYRTSTRARWRRFAVIRCTTGDGTGPASWSYSFRPRYRRSYQFRARFYGDATRVPVMTGAIWVRVR